MGKRGSKGGGGSMSLSVSTTTMIGVGIGVGLLSDAMWYSLKLPGTSTPVAGCTIITDADAIQIMIAGAMTLAGFLLNIKTFPALTFGIMSGMIIPKLIMPYLHLPRYGLFNYDPTTGAIKKAV